MEARRLDMEASLVAVSLAVVLCSFPQKFLWSDALYSVGALACTCGASLLEIWLPVAKAWTSSQRAVPKQALSFIAMLLSALASRASASEHLSHLGLTTLFWHASVPDCDRKGMLALVAMLQCVQTALVCGAHFLQNPSRTGAFIFYFSAAMVGMVVPACWWLPTSVVRAVPEPKGRGAVMADRPPGSTSPIAVYPLGGPPGRELEEECTCTASGCGPSRCQQPPPHHLETATAIKTTKTMNTTTAATALGAAAAEQQQVLPGPDDRSLELRQQPARKPVSASSGAAAGLTVSPWRTPGGNELLVRCSSSSDDAGGIKTLGSSGCVSGASAEGHAATALATIACQTDDELLLWLLTGASTAPSAAEDIRDEPRASYSGLLSPNYPICYSGELCGSAGKDLSSGGGGGSLRCSGGAGADGGRSGGISKYDSFTSVWSRSAGGWYGMAPSARVSTADGDNAVEWPAAPILSRPLEEGRFSNGSQGGNKAGPQQSAQQQQQHAHPHHHQVQQHQMLGGAWAHPYVAAPKNFRAPSASAAGAVGGGAVAANPGGQLVPSGQPRPSHPQQQLILLLPQFHLQPSASAPYHPLGPNPHPAPRAQPSWPSARNPGTPIGSGTRSGSGSGFAGGASSPAAAAAAAASAAFGIVGPSSPRRQTATDSGREAAATATAAAPAPSGSGPVTACRALAQRQRLQRSRTFNVLSPERSRVLMGLATSDAGAPSQLPPPNLDEQRLQSGPVAVPSPYSEESEDEAVLQQRALRALRRSHPELALSLDRFAARLRRNEPHAGATAVHSMTSDSESRSHDEQVTAAGSEVTFASRIEPMATGAAAAGTADVPGVGRGGGLRRQVRRTQSFSHAAAARGEADEPPLLKSVVMAQHEHQHQQHQQRPGPRHDEHHHHHHEHHRASMEMGWAPQSATPGDSAGTPEVHTLTEAALCQLVDAGEMMPLLAALSRGGPQPAAAMRVTSSDGRSGTGSATADARSELSFEQQLLQPAGGYGAAAGAGGGPSPGYSPPSSRRWSCASSSMSSVTVVPARGARLSMSAVEATRGSTSSDDRRRLNGQFMDPHGGGGAAAAGAAATELAVADADGQGQLEGAVRRAHQVHRSRSAGETGFRSGNRLLHWSQLPHQEHRRASLMQAWYAMLGEAGLQRAATSAAAAAAAAAVAGGGSPTAANSTSTCALPAAPQAADGDAALPYGSDPSSPPTADGATASATGAAAVLSSPSPTGPSPTSPPSLSTLAMSTALAASFAGGRAASGDGSGPSAALRPPLRPPTGLDSAAAAAIAAGDDRTVRLCKSLSERSLQQRLAASHHYRRLARTKSRFALLQQESSDGGLLGSCPGGSLVPGSLPRISSGGSLGSRTLENVLEEQEDDEEEGLLAGPSGTAAVAAARGSFSLRNGSDELPTAVAAARASGAASAASRRRLDGAAASGGVSADRGSVDDAKGDADFDAAFAAAVADATAAMAAATVEETTSSVCGLADGADADAAVSTASASVGGGGGGGTYQRRSAWRSTSELSFANVRVRRASAGVGMAASAAERAAGGGGGGSDSGGGSRIGRLSLDEAGEFRGTVGSWLKAGDDSVMSRLVPSLMSVEGPASLSPSLMGSNGSKGGAGAERESVVPTRTQSAAGGTTESREVEALSLAHSSGAGGAGRRGGLRRAGESSGGGGRRVGGGDSSDSDQELLDMLADETTPARDLRPVGGGALRRLRDNHQGPGKTASFRFAAPIVPPPVVVESPPPLPPPPPAAPMVPDNTSPFRAAGIAAQGGAEAATRPPSAAAAAAAGGDTPTAALAAAANDGGDGGGDDIPVPPLADPVLPEMERGRERSREWSRGQSSAGAADTAQAGGSPPNSGTLAAAGAAAGTACPTASSAASSAPSAAPPAPLSAQNLHHHTRHWESAAPASADRTALAMQLPSPSPSQSGPIDPLSDGDATPSPALLAVLNTAAAAAAAAAADDGGNGGGNGGTGGGTGVSSPSSSPKLSGDGGINSAGGVSGAASAAGGVSGPVPRSIIAARLSMSHLPYSNPDVTALVAAAGRGFSVPGLSRQASQNTIGGLSVCESAGSLTEAAAGLLQSGEGLATAAAAQQAIERRRTSVVSRSPSILVSGSNAGRSVVVRINSGGAGAGAAGSVTVGQFSGTGVGLRPTFAPSTVRQPSKLSAGAALSGGDGVEQEVEEAVLANRRLQDERGFLLEEINIDKVLGFGSMGMVYHGRLYDTKVVVKLIEHGTGVLGKEKERGRLARVEACVSRMLLHPNIVLTYDACTGSLQPGRLAAKLGRGGGMGGRGGRQRFMTVMVQEFCELGTLKDALSKRKHGLAAWVGPSPPADALPLLYRVALDIANGMKHLAALRIIHADLKAENVLLQRVEVCSDRPHGFTAKVADFGLAMVLPPGEDEIRQGIHGTVSHMPPEAMKDTVFSLATDVFSFGVVLWELFTTEAPYRGQAPHEVVEAVCGRGQRPVWPEGSPPDLVALAEDCWHSDPHQRPSFSDVVERLRQLLAPTHGPPERCGSLLSGMTEESDELEMALRQQRRGGPAPCVRGPAISETGSAADAAGARHAGAGMATQGSSRAAGGEDAAVGVPRVAPRDPLGLLLWALCQFPAEPPLRVAGPSADSEQWVLQVEDMVLRSRQEGEERAPGSATAAAAAAAVAACSSTASDSAAAAGV